jgi:hypothetical protein
LKKKHSQKEAALVARIVQEELGNLGHHMSATLSLGVHFAQGKNAG